MAYLCPHPCDGKTEYGYCRYTWCINPLHSNFGTAYQGQGVQKCIITNGDKIRASSDEELAEFLKEQTCLAHNYGYECADGEPDFPDGIPANYDYLTWLREEATDGEQD